MTLSDVHQDLVSRLEALGQGFSKDINLKLERIELLLKVLGNPQEQFRSILVGGTSGKGSVATLVTNMLETLGYRTGLFTSPYLQVVSESCLIGGKMVDIRTFSDLMDEIEPSLDQVEREGEFGRPSYFETLFALSILAFARNGVEVAVLEVGLGGRLDATNVVDAELSILTSVGLDHIEILGSTIEDIARDKVHIIKPNQVSVCGFLQEEPRLIAENFARSVGSEIRMIGKDFSWSGEGGGLITISTECHTYKDLRTNIREGFQGHNAALAVQACELFTGSSLNNQVIESCLLNTLLPGRGEVLERNPLVVIDGAHNPPKIEAALKFLQPELTGRKVAVLYASKKTSSVDVVMQVLLLKRQKDIFSLLAGIGPEAVIFTEFHSKGIWHSESSEVLAGIYESMAGTGGFQTCSESKAALSRARNIVGNEGVVLAIGSFHLAGEIRDLYYSREGLLRSQR